MPPKSSKPAGAPNKKTEQKKKDKVVEDKTFGLKNKKGAKQQKFIQQVQKQVHFGNNVSAKKLEDAKAGTKKAEDDPLDFNSIFKPVTQGQKIEKGVDPKSILCAFFKQGKCLKGDKCKFSHDLEIERKSEKRSLYCDEREADSMDTWDEAKLMEVVEKKHGEADRSKPKTDIICKFFLDAVEKSKYGWFWSCPNGDQCHYRHALPPGFVLKKDKVKEDKGDEISIEDLVETERAALNSNTTTRVTMETFVAWKKRKILERKQALSAEEDKKRSDFKAGRQVGISGREMFTFNPELAEWQFEDGDEAYEIPVNDEEQDENEYREVNFDELNYEEGDSTGATQAPEDRFSKLRLDEPGSSNGNVPIDENLFEDDDLSNDESDSSSDSENDGDPD